MILFISDDSYDYEPTTAATRADVRSRVRDYLFEQSTDVAKLWTDPQINSWISEEIHSWFGKKIFKKEVMTGTTEENAIEFDVPERVITIEAIELDTNKGSAPQNWQDMKGWRRLGDKVSFRVPLMGGYPIRLIVQRQYLVPADDIPTMGILDSEVEVLVHGTVLRAYRALMGYFVDASNWTTVAKPDGISFNQVQNWYRLAREDYKEMVKLNQKTPLPKDIDLVG